MRKKYVLASGFLGVTAVVSLLLLWPDSSTRASNTTEGLTANTSSGQMSLDSSSPTLSSSPGKVAPEVNGALSSASSVSVIVSLAGRPAPWAVAPPVDVVALADSVAASAARVLGSVPPSEFELAQQYQAVPALAGDATAAGVWALAAQPDVVHVGLNLEVRADLAQAVPLIGADDVHNLLGRTGAGVVVAVLDTGIDTDHPLLLDDLNHQKCFLDSGTCPGGGTTGPSAEDGAGHGSHVSGIITSAGPPIGIAPDALIDAFKVLDDSGSGSFSDILAAYDEIILNHPEVDIINMSLGTGEAFVPGACEDIIPALTAAIGTTRAMGMTTFASSGNSGSKSGIGYPACINDIVSVGAVYDADVGAQSWSSCADPTTAADQVVCFSQSNTSLDLLAPGSTIDSTVPGGGLANFSGTSMASPAAAASAALLLESEPLLTPANVEIRLRETGVPVTDAGNGVTTCRVNAYEAVLNDGGAICPPVGPPPPNDDFVSAYAVPEPLPYTNTQLTTDATTEVGEPLPCAAGIASTVWYSFTPSSSDTIIVNTFGSGYDTVLAVHTGPSVGSLTLLGCNDDTAGLQSEVAFSATGGTTYHIQVGGSYGFTGSLTLNMVPAPTCPDVPTFSFSVPDPVGDNFGIGSPNHDITSVYGEGDASIFCLTVEFAGLVDPADASSGQQVGGVIEFDTDQSAGTGSFPFVDSFCATPSGMGVEASLNMLSVSGDFMQFGGALLPVTFGATSFTIVIPLSLIGGDTAFNFGMVLGDLTLPTDCAPGNGGCIVSPAGTLCGPTPTPAPTPTPSAEAALLSEVKKLLASDAQATAIFGFSVAVSGDTAVVGAAWDNTGGDFAGAAYVYQRNQGGADNWGEVKKLTASDAQALDIFGWSVAVSGDIAVVGAYAEDAEGSNAGAAYVFQRNQGGADNWGEVKKLTASDVQASDQFGWSVAVSGDIAVVGAIFEDAGGVAFRAGAAYVFERNEGGAGNWGEVTKLTASDAQADDFFGNRVAVSGDTAVISADREDAGGSAAGAAYVFQRNQGGADSWGEVKKLTASDAQTGDNFGNSVAISGDTAVVGASHEDTAGFRAGAAYVFERNEGGAGNWGQVKKLLPFDGSNSDLFSSGAAVSGDTAVVGARWDNGRTGAAYVFQRNQGGAGNWGPVQKLIASDAQAGDQFGVSVAASGYTTVVGAYLAGGGAGAAYVLQEPPPPTITPTSTPTPCPGGKVPVSGGCGTPTPTPTKQPFKGDTDGDGCPDVRENGPDETLGGLRDYLNPWDFYDVAGLSGATPDGVVDLLYDVLGVIQHFSPTGAPPYDVAFDRGPTAGPNAWNMTAPDGVIDLLNDILGVVQQFGHDCR